MAHILVVYGTTEGQTRKIATYIANAIRDRGHTVTVSDSASIREPLRVQEYDGILVGGSVHSGRHQRSVVRFVKENRAALESLPSGFFSVSLAALDGREQQEEAQNYVDTFCQETGWEPEVVETVAGALRYTKYNFVKRYIMKWISKRSGRPTDTSRDFEFTDWEHVGHFVKRFLKQLETAPVDVRPSTQARPSA